MMLLIGSETGIPIRVRRLRLCHCRSLAVVLAVAALIGGCKSPWSSEPAGPATAVAAASVDPETESFSCPGVPDTSVQAVTGKVTFSAIGGREQDEEIRYLTCRGEKEDSYLFKSEFGRQTPDSPAGSRSYLYGDESNEHFTVASVPNASGEVHIDRTFGLAIIVCGDAFVNVSLNTHAIPNGDLRGNLINLATSMTPWACHGEPIPGLGVPLSPAKPSPEPTTDTTTDTDTDTDTSTPQPAPEED